MGTNLISTNSPWPISALLYDGNGINSMLFNFEQCFKHTGAGIQSNNHPMTEYWLTKSKAKTCCWRLLLVEFWLLCFFRFILVPFHKLNLVHYLTLSTTNGMIFIPKVDVVSLEHTSIQDKYIWKTKLRWSHQGHDDWNTSVMLIFHAMINPLTS